MSRLRSALLATALVAPAFTGTVFAAGSAHADPSADDVASQVITVARQDRGGDVRLTKAGRTKLNKRARAGLDLRHVKYVVDRTDGRVTVTYTVRRTPVAVKGARPYFVTIADTDVADPHAAFAVLMSRPGRPAVQVVTAAGVARCVGGTSAITKHGRVLTQTVPFSCLSGVEHARLASGAGLSARRADLGFDATRRTRDLPLTPYVVPAG